MVKVAFVGDIMNFKVHTLQPNSEYHQRGSLAGIYFVRNAYLHYQNCAMSN